MDRRVEVFGLGDIAGLPGQVLNGCEQMNTFCILLLYHPLTIYNIAIYNLKIYFFFLTRIQYLLDLIVDD